MKKIKAKDLDKAFDRGDDISEFLDTSKSKRINHEVRRVNIDFPHWVVTDLDREATRLGVTRQALVKMWIAEKLDNKAKEAA